MNSIIEFKANIKSIKTVLNVMGDRHCSLKRVLSADEAQMMRELFQKLEKEPPGGSVLAEIETEAPDPSCPMRYTWGFKSYCCNAERIKDHMDGEDRSRT